MAKRLPKEVVQYLLDNPPEVERIQKTIEAIAANAKWRAEIAEKYKNAPMVPCGTYGCTTLKNAMAVFCDDCAAEYREDPDAFK